MISWGALQFEGPDEPTTAYRIEAMADGTNFGNPKRIVEIVKSLLTDGSLAVLQGWDNREAPIRLRLSAPDGIAGPTLAAAERALMAEISADAKAPLIWVPPATDSATCVFDVVDANLDRDNSEGWDTEEVEREYRYYLLTLTCLPFARTEESVVVAALAPPPAEPTTVVIDTCDSTTGWTSYGFRITTPAVTTSSGYVQSAATTTVGGGNVYLIIKRTGAISMGATPYLRVTTFEQNLPGTDGTGGYCDVDPGGLTGMTLVAVRPSAVPGARDYYYEPPSEMTSVMFGRSAAVGAGVSVVTRIHEIARTDTIPPSGTSRQQSRTAGVTGSAPTQAAIRLYDATPADLGDETLVYTTRNSNAEPALRPFCIASAAVSTDAAMVSGERNTLTSSMVFEIEAGQLTKGRYALLARMTVTTGADLTWSARMVNAAGSTTLGSSKTVTGTAALGVTSGYEILRLGSLMLPVLDVEDDQKVELTLTGTANMTVDEAWLFGLDDGVLTWIKDTGDYLQWIEIRSPELGASRPSVFGGFGDLGENSTCIDWMCESFGAHRFDPGVMQVFTVSTSSLVSQSELEFFPRYHSHVEDESA